MESSYSPPINQDQSRLDIIQNLGPQSALLVLACTMKFLPRKFREAQSDWFGKRGIQLAHNSGYVKKRGGKFANGNFCSSI